MVRVASCWHLALQDSIVGNLHPSRSSAALQRERSLLMIASLLHDFGHLPFSHLFEEVFSELHWSVDPLHKRYDHSDIGTAKVRRFLSTAEVQGSENTAYRIVDYLSDIGYTPDDVVKLIRGETGVAYLDAIANSPIDADKIDYIFRDSSELNLGVRLMPQKPWLMEFLMDQYVSNEGRVRLSGRAAI